MASFPWIALRRCPDPRRIRARDFRPSAQAPKEPRDPSCPGAVRPKAAVPNANRAPALPVRRQNDVRLALHRAAPNREPRSFPMPRAWAFHRTPGPRAHSRRAHPRAKPSRDDYLYATVGCAPDRRHRPKARAVRLVLSWRFSPSAHARAHRSAHRWSAVRAASSDPSERLAPAISPCRSPDPARALGPRREFRRWRDHSTPTRRGHSIHRRRSQRTTIRMAALRVERDRPKPVGWRRLRQGCPAVTAPG